MLDFAFPNLFNLPIWGTPWVVPTLLLAGIPVLIHLINMLRHRRVEWAAMEFLLASLKKHRTWIILKQLLLLLLRMAAIAAVVCLIAGPELRNEFGRLFGTSTTHHVILLDDSFSMSDHAAGSSPFQQAKQIAARIGEAATRPAHPQTFTLIRFSGASRGMAPELFQQPVDKEGFTAELAGVLGRMEISQTSAGPLEAVEAIRQLSDEVEDQQQIVYLLSDFRARQWDDPAALQGRLLELSSDGAVIQLINCVDGRRPNLAVTSLAPAEGVRAAGVPWFMEVTVQNFGRTAQRDVAVLLSEDGRARPAVKIDRIEPRNSVTEPFLVRFPDAGEHTITALLQSDAVTADNFRYGVVELPREIPMPLIDGSPDGRNALYLGVALSPGGPVRTGVSPQIETPGFLNLQKSLHQFPAIALLNVRRLDPGAVEALEQYVSAGGGLAIFLGGRCQDSFINQHLYRDGQGLFPLPLVGERDLLVDRLEKSPDVLIEPSPVPHPIFRVLSGNRNSFISTVNVERYFAVPEGWRPEPDSTVRVIARLRNGAPLAVERRFGEGRVVAFLTTAAPDWNNWARNPSFVVAMLDMQVYLSQRPGAGVDRRVGSRLQLELDAGKYQPQVGFRPPAAAGDAGQGTFAAAAVRTAEGKLLASFSHTRKSGVYTAQLTRTDGSKGGKRLFALNVDAAEGDLETVSREQLAERLEGVKYLYKQASSFRDTQTDTAGSNVSDWWLVLLVLLLIGEQILAYSAGYHPPARFAAAGVAEGGAK